jgi:hypothetical protein
LYRVGEVFLGNAKSGELLDLGDFELTIEQRDGPELIAPITPAVPILLFLHHPKDSPTKWEPTYFRSSFFWVQDATQSNLLRRAAEHSVELRREWEKAASISDPKKRVAGLWPFLDMWKYGVSFLEHTESELQKASPESGEYFAERFDEMSPGDRGRLLGHAGRYGSEALQKKVRADLDHQRRVYEDFVATFGKVPKESDWNSLPDTAKDASGELYYGLAGLASFVDRRDLPFIRNIALWSVKYHLEQTADAAVDAFRDMPDERNLPVIEAILKEYLPGKKPGMWSVEIDAERALCAHKYIEIIPLVAPFVSDTFMSSEVDACLTEIVGQDLGRDPKSWIAWYVSNSAKRREN